MPPKKSTKSSEKTKSPTKTAVKKPAASKAKPVDSKSKTPAKTATSKTAVKKPSHAVGDGPVKAAFVLLFTKCATGIQMLLVKENYEKWGAPGGGVKLAESPEKAAEREFQEETGYKFPKTKKEESIRFRNAHIVFAYTEDCIEEKFGPSKRTGDDEILALKHVPVKDIYKFINKPSSDMAVRPIFTSMMLDNQKAVEKFVSSL
jgi:ADP-ribose pyrophosphatase YjhB (NUDIX family)